MGLPARLPPLETLLGFARVARCGSFTAAARELSLTQSAVSKQVRALESHLGLALFERHARGIRLTSAGAELLDEVEPLLLGLEQRLEGLRRRHDTTSVSVAATHAVAHYWLFERVLAFNREHPEITIHVQATNAIHEARMGEYDLGILYGDGRWPSLEATPLFAERVAPVCRADLPLAEPGSVADLLDYPLIQLDSRAWNCMDWQAWFAHFGIDYRPPTQAPTFNQVSLALSAAQQGMGVCLGWEFMTRELIATGRLRRLGQAVYETGQADYLVHLRHRPLAPAAARFRDWLLAQPREA